jgi:hypothetical protein
LIEINGFGYRIWGQPDHRSVHPDAGPARARCQK